VERRAGTKGNANQPARTGLSAGSRVVLALASIRQAAMLDCQYPRWAPYAGKLHVRVCAGGARQLASLSRLSHLSCEWVIASALVILVAMHGTSVTLDTRAASKVTNESRIAIQTVNFKSGDHTLLGVLYKPEGRGPFPALIWNHGSEKAPEAGPQFGSVASIFVPVGYVVFAPVRRGHGSSTGRYGSKHATPSNKKCRRREVSMSR
jgi:hypothetical protein